MIDGLQDIAQFSLNDKKGKTKLNLFFHRVHIAEALMVSYQYAFSFSYFKILDKIFKISKIPKVIASRVPWIDITILENQWPKSPTKAEFRGHGQIIVEVIDYLELF